ncbi:hypothetical protein GCM10020295_83680 [Streptomyces cinereospinus]
MWKAFGRSRCSRPSAVSVGVIEPRAGPTQVTVSGGGVEVGDAVGLEPGLAFGVDRVRLAAGADQALHLRPHGLRALVGEQAGLAEQVGGLVQPQHDTVALAAGAFLLDGQQGGEHVRGRLAGGGLLQLGAELEEFDGLVLELGGGPLPGGLRLDVLVGVAVVALGDGGAFVLGAQHTGHGLGGAVGVLGDLDVSLGQFGGDALGDHPQAPLGVGPQLREVVGGELSGDRADAPAHTVQVDGVVAVRLSRYEEERYGQRHVSHSFGW